MTGRREFTGTTKRAALKRAGGICECHRLHGLVDGFSKDGCGVRLTTGNTFYEHIICDGINGEPSLENCAVLVKTCWRKKTNTYDRRVVAKSNRVTDRDRNIKTRSGRRLPGCRDSDIRITMLRGPVWRDTGKPVGGR